MTTPRFTKVLIANRGEIALRVIRGAKRMGYQTVAVYSEADAQSLHVREADQAVPIGASPAKDSYLVIDKLIAAAKATGAGAIHPGYGFLSEREAFAQAVQDAGLVFIGPDPASIEAMGNKSASKHRMIAAGVPCVPGYQGDDQSDDTLLVEARKVGLPVMVKAAAGGGGRGMRLVFEDSALLEAIRSARSEAENAFGSGQLLIEKAVMNARHVEIQIFGDRYGNVVHLGERDCSVQRRNQKVVEEAPSPAVDDALRARMGAAAVAAAKAVQYVGAGTVEFMLADDGAFYFLEMNTRLQVEHPVTEMVYGVDLVEWQLRVAQGEAIPLSQEAILARRHGHAIEVRLCAEDPQANYLPQTGEVLRWQSPCGTGVRTDTYMETGAVISPFYDSMQAKLIAWGEDREVARSRLLRALDDTQFLGVISNKDYLRQILAHPAFASGHFSTGFIGQHLSQEAISSAAPSLRQIALAAMALYLGDADALRATHGLAREMLGWHSSHETATTFTLECRGQRHVLDVLVHDGHRFTLRRGAEQLVLDLVRWQDDGFAYLCDDQQASAQIARDGDVLWLEAEGATWKFEDKTLAPVQGAAPGSDGRLLAHSDGKLVAVHVTVGDVVAPKQTLAVLEAMKMEFQLSLPVGGIVESISVSAGQQVKNRAVLITVKPS